jgi:hypothetical protein
VQEQYNRDQVKAATNWNTTSSLFKLSWTLTPSTNTILTSVLPGKKRTKTLKSLALKANPRCARKARCVYDASHETCN